MSNICSSDPKIVLNPVIVRSLILEQESGQKRHKTAVEKPSLTLKVPKRARFAHKSAPALVNAELLKRKPEVLEQEPTDSKNFANRYFDLNLSDIGGKIMNQNTADTQQIMASGASALSAQNSVLAAQNKIIADQANKDINESSANWGLIAGLTIGAVMLTVVAFAVVGVVTGGAGDAAFVVADPVIEEGLTDTGIEMTEITEESSSSAATDGVNANNTAKFNLKNWILNNPIKAGVTVGGGVGALTAGLLGGLPLATGIKEGPFTSEQPDQSKLNLQSILLRLAGNVAQMTNQNISTDSQTKEVNPESQLQSYGNQSLSFFSAAKQMLTVNMRG